MVVRWVEGGFGWSSLDVDQIACRCVATGGLDVQRLVSSVSG
jgi:hypothetical protein